MDVEFENKADEAYRSYVCKCIKDGRAPMSRETFVANFSHRIIQAIKNNQSNNTKQLTQ